jgi:hypothetical protein
MPKRSENPKHQDVEPADAGAAVARAVRGNNDADIDALLAASAPGLLHKAIEMAHEGNGPALRLLLPEALAREQRRASAFHLPAALDTFEGLAKNSEAVIAAHCLGQLSYERAAGIHAFLLAHQKLVARSNPGETSDQGEKLASPDDFLEPMLALERVGFRSKVLDSLKLTSTPTSQE